MFFWQNIQYAKAGIITNSSLLPLDGLCRNENLKYITAAKILYNLLIINTTCVLQTYIKKMKVSFSDDYKTISVRFTTFYSSITEKLNVPVGMMIFL